MLNFSTLYLMWQVQISIDCLFKINVEDYWFALQWEKKDAKWGRKRCKTIKTEIKIVFFI